MSPWGATATRFSFQHFNAVSLCHLLKKNTMHVHESADTVLIIKDVPINLAQAQAQRPSASSSTTFV